MAHKTNTQKIKKFLKEVDPIFHAFVVSELLAKADKVLADKDAVREDMKNSMIHPDLWIAFNEHVKEYLG
jgi:hypothetical protein